MPGDHLDATVETYDRHADDYVERHADRSPIEPLVERFCERTGGGRVLDVGCGPGWETETFDERGFDVVGLDRSTAFLRRARRRHGGRYLRGDMRRLPLPDDAVDGVWAMASLLHLPRADVDDALAAFARVARPGATLFVAVKHGEGTTTGERYDGDDRRFTLFREDELCDRVREAGFVVEDSEVDAASGPRGRGWVRVSARRDPAAPSRGDEDEPGQKHHARDTDENEQE